MRIATIGMGSNSLRMLIAEVENNTIVHSQRYRESLRMFAGLDAQNNITSDMMALAIAKVRHFQALALKENVQQCFFFATSAVRDAKNQATFIDKLQESTGLSLFICSGELEAELSFFGAMDDADGGMIDIGGGSTEIAIGAQGILQYNHSLQMGAVRMLRQYPTVDHTLYQACYNCVSSLVSTLPPLPTYWVGVGGAFTATACYLQRTPLPLANVHGFSITQSALQTAIAELTPMSISERKALPYLPEDRADIAVHGMVIMQSVLQVLHIDTIHVSTKGNLEGYCKKMIN